MTEISHADLMRLIMQDPALTPGLPSNGKTRLTDIMERDRLVQEVAAVTGASLLTCAALVEAGNWKCECVRMTAKAAVLERKATDAESERAQFQAVLAEAIRQRDDVIRQRDDVIRQRDAARDLREAAERELHRARKARK